MSNIEMDFDRLHAIDPEISDGMAGAASLDSGLPYALMMTAIERAEAAVKATGSDEGMTRDAFLQELRELIGPYVEAGQDL